MTIRVPVSYLLCLLVAFRGSLTAMCTHSGDECMEDISEDTSVLLQKHALGSQIDQTKDDEIAIEEEEEEDYFIEDDLDFDLEVNSMKRGNGSRQACYKCMKAISRSTRKTMIAECKEKVKKNMTDTKLGPRQLHKLARTQVVACMHAEIEAKCEDECTYGSPCDQCKRKVSREDLKNVIEKCGAKTSAAMKELCADSCPESRNFGSPNFRFPKSGKDCLWCNQKEKHGKIPDCLWCIRRDHNFGVLKACTKKFPANMFGPVPDSEKTPEAQKDWLKCWGDKVWAKCKDRCTFGNDPCMQCKRNVIVKKEERVIRVDGTACLDAGRRSFCVDECSKDKGVWFEGNSDKRNRWIR